MPPPPWSPLQPPAVHLQRDHLAEGSNVSPLTAVPDSLLGKDGARPPMRDYLRLWINANRPDKRVVEDSHDLGDQALTHRSINSIVRTQTSQSINNEVINPEQAGMANLSDGRVFNRDDFEVGLESKKPGDLVEMRSSSSRTPVFAVYLGFIASRHHFYGQQGRWIMSTGFTSLFTVSNFASQAEIQPILDSLPRVNSTEEFDEARINDRGPPRAVGMALIEKMHNFMTEANTVRLQNLDKLDRIRQLVAAETHTKYLSLFEIADMLLPASLKKDGKFPATALFAVHTTLFSDEIIFRPLSPSSDCHRRDHLFEVFPTTMADVLATVSTIVRHYWVVTDKFPLESQEGVLSKCGALNHFINRCRRLILKYRERRASVNGYIVPSEKESIVGDLEWTSDRGHQQIIQFLQWWASYDLFEPGSRYSTYGSTILRATGLYPDRYLDQSTAWTFLQELGIIPLWEVPSRYRVRFPGTDIVVGGGISRNDEPKVKESLREDIAAEYRHGRDQQRVFCIDSPEAILIDDGVSLKPTDKSDEFWISIHAADPASVIRPDSPLSKYMELIPENIYLHGHFQAMLSGQDGGGPDKAIQDLVQKYSLSTGSPALTFSAKVNMAGDVLAHKIEPTVLSDVTYLDPEDVAAFCLEPRPPPMQKQELVVGKKPATDTLPSGALASSRKMSKAADLAQPDKESLLTLYRLAEALKRKRVEKGATPYFPPGTSVDVVFPPVKTNSKLPSGLIQRPGDPYIRAHTADDHNCSVVGNLMVLAGEVAARWAHERKLPVPYRRDVSSARYDEVRKFVSEQVYPDVEKGIAPDFDKIARVLVMTGGVQLSTDPGPHFMMGIDMYTKTTSPLRRFSDLIAHWQIHAALAKEHRLQRPLDPAQDDLNAILPFPEADLKNTLALLHMREKMARVVSRGEKDWILMALARAHRFDGTAPGKLRFTVTSRWKSGVIGTLDLFKLRATMRVQDMNNKALLMKVHVGDQFDVELLNVDPYQGTVEVTALDYIPRERAKPTLVGEPVAS
ncbi:Mitochondrial protein cyt-like protein [Emericellopsis cladophorae]|uniref:Mitochondrial protein cyt-like protein n=1 Tax=Emericellopsis cladophorae TaxID=2686198 RepID=A0A9P9Y960_9HYPO|nr:Mitochondrial protein cyt-like protein [Emericellopsis cladophorae]KAI6785874.1 Mitochondrial protein cyt-like protein [Emericellopsis cladophorae]